MNIRLPLAGIAAIALLASATAATAADGRCGERSHDHRHEHRHEHAMQEVGNAAAAGESGAGWRYFSDARARRAVVISPEGDYYFSCGKGMRMVAAAQAFA